MAVKTVTTKSGKTIKVELVRKVQDKVANLDGDRFVTGREIVEYTNITFLGDNGKVIAKGKEISSLYPNVFDRDAKAMEQGAVGQIGNAYIRQDVADLINAALAELDAENPKSDEQLAIEQAKAEAHARWEADLPAIMAAEELERKMDDPNSDY